MAAVEITISGMLYDKLARTTQNVVLIGEASLSGVTIGGGPIIPPEQQPPWPGVPKPPIVGHPIWPPNVPGHPLPTPPIDPPTEPPASPADPNWEWGWNPGTGWIPVYTPGDKPTPVPPPPA